MKLKSPSTISISSHKFILKHYIFPPKYPIFMQSVTNLNSLTPADFLQGNSVSVQLISSQDLLILTHWLLGTPISQESIWSHDILSPALSSGHSHFSIVLSPTRFLPPQSWISAVYFYHIVSMLCFPQALLFIQYLCLFRIPYIIPIYF